MVQHPWQKSFLPLKQQSTFASRYWTPLIIASRFGSEESVAALLAAKAEPNASQENGKTPLHMAAQYGSPKTVKLLLNAGADTEVADNSGWTKTQCSGSGWCN